jgi:hypothetical protein
MGKNRDGKFIPPKGRPSGEGTPKAGLKPVLNADDPDKGERIADKYTDGPDQPAANVHVRHINRNTEKEEIDSGDYS